MRLPFLSCGLLLCALPFSACDGDDPDPPEILASGTIGPAGGSLSVAEGPLAGASISIPAGALTSNVDLSFFEDAVTLTPGIADVGPALRIEPEGTTFALPALLTLPFDPALVPPPTAIDDYLVRVRLADGRTGEALPRQVDAALGRATADVMQLATWWVSVPDAIETATYLPLESGDVYQYDDGLRLNVVVTRAEPNFNGVPMTRLTFSTDFGFFFGLYFGITAEGAVSLLGEFEMAFESRQERLDGPILLLDAVDRIGEPNEAFYTFTGYMPYGGLVPAYLGTGHMITTLVERTELTTVAGTFDDVVLMQMAVSRSDSRPRSFVGTMRMWLAAGVGPVQVQFDQNPPARLLSAIVGGVPIPGDERR